MKTAYHIIVDSDNYRWIEITYEDFPKKVRDYIKGRASNNPGITLRGQFSHSPNKIGTFTSLTINPVISGEFRERDPILWGLISRSCELLPVRVDDEELFLMHLTCEVDCLNSELSNLSFNNLQYYSFFSEKVPSGKLFRFPEIRSDQWVASDSDLPPEEDFYQWYHKQGYTGLRFKKHWQSDQ